MSTQDLGQYRHTGREVVTDEFAVLLNKPGSMLPDDLQISNLDISTYSSGWGKLNKPFIPEVIEWFTLFYQLNGPQKSQLGQVLKVMINAGLNTVGEVRKATIEEIVSRKTEYGHIPRGMSQLRAAFLKKVFEKPVPLDAAYDFDAVE